MSVLDITLRQFLEFAVYALPGVMFWYFLFRFQNRKALPQDIARDTFFIGIFSVIPLFVYQWVYQNYLPKLSTEYLGNLLASQGLAMSIGQMLLGFISLGVLFVLLIGGFTIFYSLFTKDSVRNTFKALVSEPLNFGATSIIFLFVLIFDILLRTFTPFYIPPGLIGTTFILAILEEYSKHLITRLFGDHKIKSVANAIELSIIVALSFAFLENIIYFTQAHTSSLKGVIIGRSIISMFGHIIFSAIFGYYYGISKFAKNVLHVTEVEKKALSFPKWIYRIFHFKTANTYKAQKIFEGLVLATLVHFCFNIFLEYNLFIGVIPILVGGGYLIYLMLNNPISQREFGLIGSKEMPEEDFERLTWKISVMKHLQDIKKKYPDRDDPARKEASVKRHLKAIKKEHPDARE